MRTAVRPGTVQQMRARMQHMSGEDARRIALAAQGFGAPRRSPASRRDLLATISRLSLHQIDSVNVLVRAHYLPAFSRLGGYDPGLLDDLAWGRKPKRRLFEYWAHEASLLPHDLHPLFRWRMAEADRGQAGWKALRAFASERRPEAMAVLQRIRDEGPLAASDFGSHKATSGWWSRSDAKQALEWLFWAGHVTTATRRKNFERVYDVPERVLPAELLGQPTPSEAEAHRLLVSRAARALGVATALDLRDYFRLRPGPFGTALNALVEDGTLLPVRVEGWRQPAFLAAGARSPRKIEGQALLAPFDPLIWERSRTERLFGFRYRLEIYTAAARRVHGYYVLPFLFGDRLAARVDLKSDRKTSRLIVNRLTMEPASPAGARDALAKDLAAMAAWLGLEAVQGL